VSITWGVTVNLCKVHALACYGFCDAELGRTYGHVLKFNLFPMQVRSRCQVSPLCVTNHWCAMVFWCGGILIDFVHFVACSPTVFSSILKIPQFQVLADSDEQEVVFKLLVTMVKFIYHVKQSTLLSFSAFSMVNCDNLKYKCIFWIYLYMNCRTFIIQVNQNFSHLLGSSKLVKLKLKSLFVLGDFQ
jgi:hypothetical protein